MNYLALIQGGIGPDVWDEEKEISAVDFMDAAKQAARVAEELHGVVTISKAMNDGGPAFPVAWTDQPPISYGMTLRDYFAAKVLQGQSARPDERTWKSAVGGVSYEDWRSKIWREDAAYCYAIADAMLAERIK